MCLETPLFSNVAHDPPEAGTGCTLNRPGCRVVTGNNLFKEEEGLMGLVARKMRISYTTCPRNIKGHSGVAPDLSPSILTGQRLTGLI